MLKQEIIDSLPPSSGEVDPAEVEQIVIDYLTNNPPSAVEPGQDGVSPTVSVTETENGYTITIEDVNGTQTIDVLNGKDGYTPVKGVDYFTDEDVAIIATEAAKQVSIDQVTPEQVVFPDGATTTYAIGKVTLTNGSGTLVEPGGTLADFFEKFVDEKNPSTTQPSVSLTFSQGKAYEVGTYVTPTYSATLNPGKYTYGPATGVTATAWEVTDNSSNSS
jgi:hypothetical protein